MFVKIYMYINSPVIYAVVERETYIKVISTNPDNEKGIIVIV